MKVLIDICSPYGMNPDDFGNCFLLFLFLNIINPPQAHDSCHLAFHVWLFGTAITTSDFRHGWTAHFKN